MAPILKLGNCLDLIKEIPNNSIDLLVTDPPYCVGATSNGKSVTWADQNLIAPFFEQYFCQIKRVLKDGANFYIFTDWRTYPLLYPMIITKMPIKNCIIWDKESIGSGHFYRFSHEFIIYGMKGEGYRKFEANARDIWKFKRLSNGRKIKWHQTEKPIDLVKEMILNSSKEGDLVLDTFMGSGTTAVVCLKANRKFIGFEIDNDTFIKANERIFVQV